MGILNLRWWQNILMLLGATTLVFQQLGTILGLQGGISFLLLLALLKSYEGKTKRDWQVMVLVMLFLLAGAVLFDQELWTGLWTLLCLVCMAVTLALLNEISWRVALRQSFLAFMLTLLPMALLFVSMPRRSTPFWDIPQASSQSATTGMSEIMKPGTIGDLVQSNEPAFTATFDNGFVPRQQDLYWRVMILAHHTGTEWRMMQDFSDRAQVSGGRAIDYNLIIEDDKGRIPVLDYMSTDTRKRRGMVTEAGNMLRVVSRKGVRRIQLQAALSNELPHELNESERQFYTRLPDNRNLRTQALARSLYEQNGGNAERFAQAAYDYFTQQKFIYTLKPPVLGEQNATDAFLFGSKQGFCEHYADAYVTMMRAAGVPARVVVGYQGGEYNSSEQYWQIRSKDAHAWAEVWLPERQVWKRIDPTAAVASVRIDSGLNDALAAESDLIRNSGWWARVGDQGRYYWQQWIVNYDNERQQNLFTSLGLGSVNAWSIALLLIFGGALAILPIVLWWRQSRKQDLTRPLDSGFMLFKRCVLGKDFPHWAAVAPLELRQKLQDEGRLSPELDVLLQDYVRLNYAGSPVSRREALAWYAQARKLAHKHRYRTTST